VTLADLQRDFGDEVASLVNGVTKLAQLPRVSKEGNQPIDRNTESLRKTFLAMNEDVRVVLIKLADRLHNMRTLGYVRPEKQERIARETLEIFAPLANRLGIWQMKSELEDLGFRYTDQEGYREIAAQVQARSADRDRMIANITESVRQQLAAHGIETEVSGRPKHIYSIFRKMQRKGVNFDEVYDVRAVRVIVKDRATCYAPWASSTACGAPSPASSTTISPSRKTTSTSRCTPRCSMMTGRRWRCRSAPRNARGGGVRHCRALALQGGLKRDEAFDRRVNQLRSLLAWQGDVSDAHEYVASMKSNVLEERIYVFTPKGDIIDLPAGSTPIDFAYHVHTSVGDRCRGAKVNGKLVSLDYKLKTGEKVEIVTAKQGGPSRDWLNPDLKLVHSQRALQKIASGSAARTRGL